MQPSKVTNPVPKFPQALWRGLIAKISKTTKIRPLEENILAIKRPNISKSKPEIVLNPNRFLKKRSLRGVRNLLYRTLFFDPIIQYMNSSDGSCLTVLT